MCKPVTLDGRARNKNYARDIIPRSELEEISRYFKSTWVYRAARTKTEDKHRDYAAAHAPGTVNL